MQSPLKSALANPTAQNQLAQEFWSVSTSQPATEFDSQGYLQHYSSTVQDFLHDDGIHTSAKTLEDVVNIVTLIKSKATRDDVRTGVIPSGTTSKEEAKFENSINLAARLFCMIDIGSIPAGFSGPSPLEWKTDSLHTFIAGKFSSTPELSKEKVKLERIFIGQNLERIAGLKIIWTNNLVNHLRLSMDDTHVSIFHHASFLEAVKNT